MRAAASHPAGHMRATHTTWNMRAPHTAWNMCATTGTHAAWQMRRAAAAEMGRGRRRAWSGGLEFVVPRFSRLRKRQRSGQSAENHCLPQENPPTYPAPALQAIFVSA
jgi:hypothetical protein